MTARIVRHSVPVPAPGFALGVGQNAPVWEEASNSFQPQTQDDLTLSLDHRVPDGGGRPAPRPGRRSDGGRGVVAEGFKLFCGSRIHLPEPRSLPPEKAGSCAACGKLRFPFSLLITGPAWGE